LGAGWTEGRVKTWLAALSVLLGALLMAFGFAIGPFMCARPDLPCEGPTLAGVAFYGGVMLMTVGLARLLWAGWHGSRIGWLIAAPAAGLLTWVVYERIRQGPLPGIGILGTMTAPTLSLAVAIGVIAVAVLRTARPPRDIAQR
jgi:hypothetical protein